MDQQMYPELGRLQQFISNDCNVGVYDDLECLEYQAFGQVGLCTNSRRYGCHGDETLHAKNTLYSQNQAQNLSILF